MLDEIINYVQSLQRQVEVIKLLSSSFLNDLVFKFKLPCLVSLVFSTAVSVYEVGFREYQAGIKCGCFNVKGCKLIIILRQ